MINFKDYLTEGRDAPLYHSTNTDYAISILSKNALLDNTNHGNKFGYNFNNQRVSINHFKKEKSKELKGVSLTRSIKTAIIWRSYGVHRYSLENKVIFEINQPKLIQNYRVNPINIYGAIGYNNYSKQEALFEEFVEGPIQPLSKYLNCVWIGNYTFKNLMESKYAKKYLPMFLNVPLKHIETKEMNVFTNIHDLEAYIHKNYDNGKLKYQLVADYMDKQNANLYKFYQGNSDD